MTNLVFIIALTLYGEAAGEGEIGQRAVASVIWHRAKGEPAQMGQVCKRPMQFSCWNNGKTPKVGVDVLSQKAWAQCKTVGVEMATDAFVPTIRADHYHSTRLPPPSWTKDMGYVETIGNHKFYWSKGVSK